MRYMLYIYLFTALSPVELLQLPDEVRELSDVQCPPLSTRPLHDALHLCVIPQVRVHLSEDHYSIADEDLTASLNIQLLKHFLTKMRAVISLCSVPCTLSCFE